MKRYTRKPKRVPRARRATTARRIVRKTQRASRKASLFPLTKSCKLIYKNPSTTITSNGIVNYRACIFKLNSCYDLDYNNEFGNKQPLYFDYLCTANGPYANFQVNAWKTTIKFINLSDKALNVYYDHGQNKGIFESDTPTEIQNRQGVSHRMVTAQGNAKPMCIFTSYRTIKPFYPKYDRDSNLAGSFSADPFNLVYGTLLAQTIDGSTTAFSYAIEVTHVFYTQLYNRDMILS